MALTAFYFAWRQQFERHKRVTRWLHPIWLYVSVTGVLVYIMLRPYYPA
jgi:putative membrane protein